jgi:hypothetical protein
LRDLFPHFFSKISNEILTVILSSIFPMFDQLKAYIKAQHGLLGIEVSPSSAPSLLEEVKSELTESSVYFWHLGEGLQDLSSENLESGTQDVQGVLEYLEEELEDNPDLAKVYCFWNLQGFLQENRLVKAKLLSLCFKLKGTQHTLLLLEEAFDLPDLGELMPVLSYSLPHPIRIEEELSVLLNQMARCNPLLAMPVSEKMVRACQGLTLGEIGDIFRYSVFRLKEDLSEDTLISEFTQAKTQKLKPLGVELCNQPDCPVGGLPKLKTWLKRRTHLFSNAMQNLSLPQPKGVAIIGVPGCGKSLVAKNIGKILGIPVMGLDMGAIYNSLVGSSERNLRQVLKTAEAIAPVVLLIDELEKAFASAGSSSSNDSGVSARLFGTFLTWMQDKTTPVFIVATANRVESLPPEFLRKGRFDEIFFVDLPTSEERLEILGFHLTKAGVKVSQVGQEWLASATDGYTGSELAHLVTEAKIIAMSENHEKVERIDFEVVLGEMQPQAETQYEQINLIRSWARMYARPAS